MDHVRLGRSGLKVSSIVLGCMSYGEPHRGPHEWTLPEDQARPFFVKAIESGITTFDTADMYSDGTSEEITGRMLAELAKRDEIEIATKVFFRTGAGANNQGLSRVHILDAIDQSLRRLGTDYVDLYQIHRWDDETPIEETMEALHDVVKSGKARYIGASSMWAWQFQKAQHVAETNGWTRFVSMQDQYNLLQREEEREMHKLTLDQGVGVLPWSPLARGRLTRPWGTDTAREGTDAVTKSMYGQAEAADRAIVDAVAQVADARGVSRAQVALAWVRQQEAVTAPIVGATKPQHLDDAVASLDVTLSADELAALEAPYTPRLPEGF
ncbi:aldo/keto reductase [Herbiconiux sp. KACC 21604]|uniref:aldo/keto reductase n=1 Tax=unclassified Herbiconiux TaxID=2618217 RepID=UPI0014927592|nr:aldo/keto reductase [Herbiconiux sp. SALV-R1]QJU52996.1 aldo/keto reductase [Herbiconiux sp. SALV-R1]WPO87926.1 aldo/keto reductase [Herbiconiux sp. KACC 21604]